MVIGRKLPATRKGVTMSLHTFTIDKSHSEIAFQVRHLLTKVRGQFDDYEGTIQLDTEHPELSSVLLTIQAGSITTFHGDRDTHLRSADFLDVAHHPEIRFRSAAIRSLAGGAYEVDGDLEMRGIRKRVALRVDFHGTIADPWGQTRAGFELETSLNRKEFGITFNIALDHGGVVIGDEVKVTINLETVRLPAAAVA
jgi:polyisoprenoid-binding protein YceI